MWARSEHDSECLRQLELEKAEPERVSKRPPLGLSLSFGKTQKAERLASHNTTKKKLNNNTSRTPALAS